MRRHLAIVSVTVLASAFALAPGAETHMTIEAKWSGPCAAGQKPGDVIMSNGMSMNVLDMQKMRGAPTR